MHKRASKSLAMSVVAVIVALAGSSAAFAAGSFDVTAGSAPDGTVVDWSAATVGALPQVTFKNVTGGVTLNCASGSLAGSVTAGPGRDGGDIGAINGPATVFNTCTWPFGLVFVVTGRDTWSLDATGDTVGGVTPVTMSGVALHFASSGCSFDVTGTLDGSYANGATGGSLTLPGTSPTLTVSGLSGSLCSLLNYANGHAVSLKTTYGVSGTTPAYNPIHLDGAI